MEAILNKFVEMIWEKLEPKITKACEEGYIRGRVYGYGEGHEDGAATASDDLIRRMTYVYDYISARAKEDAYAEAGAIDIEEISKEQFDAIIDDMGEI